MGNPPLARWVEIHFGLGFSVNQPKTYIGAPTLLAPMLLGPYFLIQSEKHRIRWFAS